MPITPHNLVRHELIGLKVRVQNSTDPTQKRVTGTVTDESYNTIKIETKGKEKMVVKGSSVFVFTLPDKTKVQVNGKLLIARPEDRIKKRFPKW